MQVGLFDKEFEHLHNYCGYDTSEKLQWVKNEERDVTVFTERCYGKVRDCNAKVKVAWALEPHVIHPYAYEDLKSGMHNHFDYVLTFDNEFAAWLKENSKAEPIFWTPGGSWIWKRDWKIYPKTKNISIVASTKDWSEGHKLRQQVIKKYAKKFDLICGYGRPNVVEHKVDIFKDYRYSVVIENCQTDDYWTDKIIDCFACGTIPIFWGTKNIWKHFMPKGILVFDTIEELGKIIQFIESDGHGHYKHLAEHVEYNFGKAKEYNTVEDYMYETFFKRFE